MSNHAFTQSSPVPSVPVPSVERILDPGRTLAAMPLGSHACTVAGARDAIRRVLAGHDDRLLVITGPCSVHDPAAACEYARWLAAQQLWFHRDLLLVMRCYVDKPRTAGGWTGLIYDPDLDGSCDLTRGLRIARALLVELAAMGVPAATEWVDPQLAPYLADTMSWGTIGARTAQSQVHRYLASGLPMPVGFKNGTDGSIAAAVNGCAAAARGHTFLGCFPWDGTPTLIRSAGNPDTCVVLRGGAHGPNYARADVDAALAEVAAAGLPRRVVIDASHGNSGKDHRRQPGVALAVAAQVAAASPASSA